VSGIKKGYEDSEASKQKNMNKKSEETLRNFIAKATTLKKYSFLKSSKKLRLTLSITPNEEGFCCYIQGVEQEQIDAFLFTFRLFIQDNDNISIRYLFNNVFNDPEISEKWKNIFSQLRHKLNIYLDDYPTERERPTTQKSPKRRDILNIMLYGNLSHLTRNKEYEERMQLFFNPGYDDYQLIIILRKCYKIINAVSFISKKELASLN